MKKNHKTVYIVWNEIALDLIYSSICSDHQKSAEQKLLVLDLALMKLTNYNHI
jgi:hypothetical protein